MVYWLVAGAVVLLTVLALIIDRLQLTMSLMFAVQIVQLVAKLIVAAKYIIISKSLFRTHVSPRVIN